MTVIRVLNEAQSTEREKNFTINQTTKALATALVAITAAQASITALQALASAPNILINGDFQINQRGYAGAALASGVFGHDRWKADTSGATYTVSGFVASLTAGTIVQVIPPPLFGVANLASTAVTVSVDTPSADLTITLGSVSGTITSGTGRKSVTLTPAAGDTGNLSFKIAKASAGTVTFGRVKAEVGTAQTPWVARTSGEEFRLAQRFFQRVGGEGSNYQNLMLGYWKTTATAEFNHRMPVAMHATPTLSYVTTAALETSNAGTIVAVNSMALNVGVNHSAYAVEIFATLATATGVLNSPCHLAGNNSTAGFFDLIAEL